MSQPEGVAAPALDAAWLEKLRTSGIRIDREGRFEHEGEPFAHEGMRQALYRWLDRLPSPDGRYVLRLDERRFAYVDVEDTPLVATSARIVDGQALLALTDGSEQPLDVGSLTVDAAGVLRAFVRGGKLEARLATSATAALADVIGGTPDRPTLTLSGRCFEIPRRRTSLDGQLDHEARATER